MRTKWLWLLLSLGASWLGCSIPDRRETGFDFTHDAFPFANFDTAPIGSELTADQAVRLFGADAVCFGEADAGCAVRPEAQAWIDQVNATLVHGHSEGIAVLSQLMFLHKVAPPEAGKLPLTPAIAGEITFYAATQGLAEAHERDQAFQAKDVMPFLADALAPGQDEGWRLLIAMRTADGFKGGHAVVPFGYFKGTKDGQYFLRLYDSNFPNTERRLELDTVANTWRYDGSFDAENPRTYEGNAENGNLLYFSPVTSRLRTFTPPFAPGGSLAVTADKATVLVEGGGASVGLKDGKVVEQGGHLYPRATDCFCRLPNEVTNLTVGADGGTAWPATVQVTGGGYSDNSTVNVSGPGVTVKADGVKGSDSLTVDSTGKTVTYTSGGDGTTSITVTTTKPDGSTTTVTVTVSKPVTSIKVDTSDPNNIKVEVDATDSGTTVNVTVTDTSTSGATKTTTAQGTTTGKDVTFAVQPQAGTSTTNTNVNVDTCLNQKKDPQEADVDCGAFCEMQPWGQRANQPLCLPGASCLTDADCFGPTPLASCLNHVCGTASCTDGAKNGYESDVDCGASNCLCSQGRICTQDRNCAVGLDCIFGRCLPGVSHTLTVKGLGRNDRVTVKGQLDGVFTAKQVQGTPNAGDVPLTLTAMRSMKMYERGESFNGLVCRLDRTNVVDPNYGNLWQWDRPSDGGLPVSESNSMTCTRTRASLSYSTEGTGCPYREQLSDGGYVYFPTGPTLMVEMTGVRQPYPVDVIRTLTDTRSLGSYSANPDGGYAYQVTVGAATVDYATEGLFSRTPTNLRYRYGCTAIDPTSGYAVPQSGEQVIRLSCTCDLLQDPDAGMDAGVDAGMDAGMDAGVDAGMDAGVDAGVDAGIDAGVDAGIDAGVDAGIDAGVDAGIDAGVDAGVDAGFPCTLDSECGTNNNCDCGASSGNCAGNSGQCVGVKRVFSTPTADGMAASGTFTVPATCTTLRVSAWGAAGGGGATGPFPLPALAGGAGGYVSGQLSVASGDVITVWIGGGGTTAGIATGGEGTGSYLGTPANGGAGDGMPGDLSGGIGGGLTSVRQTGSATRAFSVPGGAGGGSIGIAEPAGGTGAGGATTKDGESATFGSNSGGGGAGENGGAAGTGGMPGGPGAYGLLPAGLTSQVGSGGAPPATTATDYSACPSDTATAPAIGGQGGHGCVVLRCVP